MWSVLGCCLEYCGQSFSIYVSDLLLIFNYVTIAVYADNIAYTSAPREGKLDRVLNGEQRSGTVNKLVLNVKKFGVWFKTQDKTHFY